jgi:hypothetical protein
MQWNHNDIQLIWITISYAVNNSSFDPASLAGICSNWNTRHGLVRPHPRLVTTELELSKHNGFHAAFTPPRCSYGCPNKRRLIAIFSLMEKRWLQTHLKAVHKLNSLSHYLSYTYIPYSLYICLLFLNFNTFIYLLYKSSIIFSLIFLIDCLVFITNPPFLFRLLSYGFLVQYFFLHHFILFLSSSSQLLSTTPAVSPPHLLFYFCLFFQPVDSLLSQYAGTMFVAVTAPSPNTIRIFVKKEYCHTIGCVLPQLNRGCFLPNPLL